MSTIITSSVSPTPAAAADPAALTPIDPDRPPVRAHKPHFKIASHALGQWQRGDTVNAADFPPGVDADRVRFLMSLPLPTLVPLPGVDIDAAFAEAAKATAPAKTAKGS